MRSWISALLFVLVSVPSTAQPVGGSAAWPRRVLITNDDGIDHPSIQRLAQAFAAVAETYVVAPAADASGQATRYAVLSTTDRLVVRPRDLGPGIVAYAVEGMPADAVQWAVTTRLADTPPDLVISGINPGPNLADSWLVSGTIGAARVAAHLGLPAVAVSGFDEDDAASLDAVVAWVVALASSPLVREMAPPAYLTVSLPQVAPGQIKGVKFVAHRRLLPDYRYVRADTAITGADVWRLQPARREPTPSDDDVQAVRDGYIAIVPMRAEEHDYEALRRLAGRAGLVPPWPR